MWHLAKYSTCSLCHLTLFTESRRPRCPLIRSEEAQCCRESVCFGLHVQPKTTVSIGETTMRRGTSKYGRGGYRLLYRISTRHRGNLKEIEDHLKEEEWNENLNRWPSASASLSSRLASVAVRLAGECVYLERMGVLQEQCAEVATKLLIYSFSWTFPQLNSLIALLLLHTSIWERAHCNILFGGGPRSANLSDFLPSVESGGDNSLTKLLSKPKSGVKWKHQLTLSLRCRSLFFHYNICISSTQIIASTEFYAKPVSRG